MAALDEAIAETNEEPDQSKPSQVSVLTALAESAALFHTPDRTAYGCIEINGHRETWRVDSRCFKNWLVRVFFEETGRAPGSEALAAAIRCVEAKAQFDAPEREVFLRVGAHEDRLYLDLCDDRWRDHGRWLARN
jgi:hypothetical protein